MAVFLALLSMLCAAVNDFVFKMSTRRGGSVGLLMGAVGVVWAVVFSFPAGTATSAAGPETTWFWGLVSGLFSAVANVLLIEGMARNQVGLCSTVYRLNLAPAAVMAFVFLDEHVSLNKVMGLCLAVLAVFLLSGRERNGNQVLRHSGSIWLVVLAAVLRAGMGISYKMGLIAGAERFAMLAINGGIWILAGFAYHFLRSGLTVPPAWRETLKYGVLSGFLVCGIVFFMMIALEAGDASVVLPVAQLSFLLTTVFGMVWLHERVTRRRISGIVCAIGCILFLGLS